MFVEFFDWFCNSLKVAFSTMDKFILFDNFSYFDFACAILATGIIFRIFKLIFAIEDEEAYYGQPSFNNIKPQYDTSDWNKYNNRPIVAYSWYKPKHRASYRSDYEPKHEIKGRHGK